MKLRALDYRYLLENLADLGDLGALEACAVAAEDEAFAAPVDPLEVALEVAVGVEAGELAAREIEALVVLPGFPPLPPLVVEEAAGLVEADAVLLVAEPPGAALDAVLEAPAVPVDVTDPETEAVPEAVAVAEVGTPVEEAGSSALGSTRLFPLPPFVPGRGWPEVVTVN